LLWPDLLRSNGGTVTIAPQIDAGLQAQLDMARQVQLRLLPDRRCCISDWEVAFSYESAGFVSGDYIDLIPAGADAFYFALGDVSGKGVAASMLMSHLHATLRTLLPSNRTIEEVVTAASSTFVRAHFLLNLRRWCWGKQIAAGMLSWSTQVTTQSYLSKALTLRLLRLRVFLSGCLCDRFY